uniref:Centromere protein U n=1 Tax=Jaculus jaculus TaxID=51337 RepID=A0A8C5P1L7_JACJA
LKYSKNTLGRTLSMKHKAGQKYKSVVDMFDFPDNSDVSNIGRLGENERDEEPYETFDPPLHSTAIYADEEEFSKHCGSAELSTPQGKVGESLNSAENEASENKSVKLSTKKPRKKLEPISSEFKSTNDDVRRRVQSIEKVRTQHKVPTIATLVHSEKPAESITPERAGPHSTQYPVERETGTTQRQLETQKKRKVSPGKRKRLKRKATDSDISGSKHIWCLEEKRIGDIMELDIVLSVFEKTILEYKHSMESRICKKAVNKFHAIMKEELIRMLKEVQMLKNLKRQNAKTIFNIERKRRHLIEVQDELLRVEPQLKQLQTKLDELKERKSSLKNSVCFLSSLKQLYQDYSGVQEEKPNVKESYDSSSFPALLFKARPLWGAEKHLQNINHQLEVLLNQE